MNYNHGSEAIKKKVTPRIKKELTNLEQASRFLFLTALTFQDILNVKKVTINYFKLAVWQE